MPAAIVELIRNDDCRPPKQRVEWISDLYLAPNSGHYEVASDRGGQRAAAIYSLIVTAKLNDVDRRLGWPMFGPHRRASGPPD